MDPMTRGQLLSLSTEFYRAHAEGFDASRGHEPWPGWQRLLEWLPRPESGEPLRVLDVGCGNARLATFLTDAGFRLRYVGIDANAALLASARDRLGPERMAQVELIEADFFASESPGADLPGLPFDFVALFGVLHHVPGVDWRRALLIELADRVAIGGILALAAWQFAGRPRFVRRTVPWSALGPVLGEPLDPARLEEGDVLLRFGADPTMPPRYCHQVADAELDDVAEMLEGPGRSFEAVADFRADGAEGDLNRYRVLRRLDALERNPLAAL